MIIECPDCGTKYTVREEAIKPRGRTVRCTTCGKSWHAEGSESKVEPWDERFKPDPQPVADDNAVSRATHDPDDERETPAPKPETVSAHAEEDSFEPSAAAEPDRIQPVEDEPFVARAHRIRTTEPEPELVHGSKMGSLGILAVSLALLAEAVVFLRPQAEKLWPASGRLYQLAGLKGGQAGQGLELRNVHAYLDTQATGKNLTIEATIANTWPTAQPVPALHASLVSTTGPEQQWTFGSGASRLEPKGTVNVKTSFDGGGTENGKILLTFSTETNPDFR